jgi:hypothetical protein
LFEALGFPVIDLHRERIGGLSVRGIPPGGFRPLSRAEVELLEQRPQRRWRSRSAERGATTTVVGSRRTEGRARGVREAKESSGPGGPVLPARSPQRSHSAERGATAPGVGPRRTEERARGAGEAKSLARNKK